MCDWVNGDLPYSVHTPAGPILNVPINHELSDRQIITVQQHSADSYAGQIQDAYELMAREAEHYGGRLLPLHVTPYIMGLRYRIDAFERVLAWLAVQPTAGFATTGEVAKAADQPGFKKT